jgi:hypothetical protein
MYHPMQTRSQTIRQRSPSILKVILNKTEGYYFVYHQDHEDVLKSLFEKNVLGESRWRADDKIVFVPDHLRAYVIHTYENVFPFEHTQHTLPHSLTTQTRSTMFHPMQTRSQSRRQLMEIQTRSKTRSQRSEVILYDFKVLLTGYVNHQGAERARAVYDLVVYLDANFSSIRSAIEMIYPTVWASIKAAMIRCKKDVDEGKTSSLMYLEKNECKEIVRMINKLATMF